MRYLFLGLLHSMLVLVKVLVKELHRETKMDSSFLKIGYVDLTI
jgi:hypothetical protein